MRNFELVLLMRLGSLSEWDCFFFPQLLILVGVVYMIKKKEQNMMKFYKNKRFLQNKFSIVVKKSKRSDVTNKDGQSGAGRSINTRSDVMTSSAVSQCFILPQLNVNLIKQNITVASFYLLNVKTILTVFR